MEETDEQMLEAAETLILCSLLPLNRPPPTICDLWPLNPPKPATNLEMISSLFLPPWGLRSRRSRCSCISKPEQEDQSSGRAATTRPSPTTPLDFGATYLPSTSGSDEAPSLSVMPMNKIRRRTGDSSVVPFGDVDHKVSAVGGSPLVGVAITSSKPIRLQGKKKTITELQAQERVLVDENTMLRKRVESKRKEVEALIAENRRLQCEKSSLQHLRAVDEAAKPQFSLPDLNEPAMET